MPETLLVIFVLLAIATLAIGPPAIREKVRRSIRRLLPTDLRGTSPDLPGELTDLLRDANERNFETLGQHLKDIAGHVEAVRRVAEERGLEIERLREGYDFVVTRSYARGIIKVVDLVQDFQRQLSESYRDEGDAPLHEVLRRFEAIESQLTFLLEANQIEPFSPAAGDSLSEQASRLKPIEKRPAPSPSQVGKVVDVKYPGYLLVLGDSRERVVREAQVSVFCATEEGSSAK